MNTKVALTGHLVLVMPDYSKPFEVVCDVNEQIFASGGENSPSCWRTSRQQTLACTITCQILLQCYATWLEFWAPWDRQLAKRRPTRLELLGGVVTLLSDIGRLRLQLSFISSARHYGGRNAGIYIFQVPRPVLQDPC